MGCGKSSIGPVLANELGYRFIDLDREIERQKGPITEFFEESGEEGFRTAETEALRDVVGTEGLVVAVGGGAVTVEENRHLMRQHGNSVYLKVPLDILVERLSRSRARPLLFADDGSRLDRRALEERIATMLAERAPFYESSDIVVDLDRASVDEAAKAVAAQIASAKRSI